METVLIPTKKVDLAPELLEQTKEEKQVIITVRFRSYFGIGRFVDPEVQLVCRQTGQVSRLLSFHNAELFPRSRPYRAEDPHPVMVFEGLPQECTAFDLREPRRPGVIAWLVDDVPRNQRDVYTLLVE
ncbi:hypothetical protein [Lewinella sp. W8]|uniref:hypothetical protein n=1 Tax=Lewinella sp. W8 TaxID=2528208 RepID=UPI0010681B7A|nr:hypothetical protein [Lewinella sp. W8]MTB51739.1 hypothetical protein [Lewinella sp. W8]